MVVEVRADTGDIGHHVHTEVAKVLARTDSGEEKQLWCSDYAGRQYYLAVGE